MVKLSDIAAACGTSTATVSYVLSGRADEKRISTQTRNLILTTAKEMGYKRREIGEDPEQPRIAVFLPQRGLETMYPAVMAGLNSALLLEPIPVAVQLCPYESNNLKNQSSLWTPRSYDAAIIVSANSEDLLYLSQIKSKIPVVLNNRTLLGYSSVSANHEKAGEIAALHALCKGGEDIALITNSVPFLGLNLRGNSFSRTCAKYGVDMRNRILYCQNDVDDGYELGLKVIRENKVPKVVVALYDFVAYGFLSALAEYGIKVGEDTQVLATSSGMQQFFSHCIPPMTVVDLHIEECVQRATRLAIDIATRRINKPITSLIEPSITYRASSPMPTFQEHSRLQELSERKMADR